MPPVHQFLTTQGTLDADLVISTGRVQVILFQISNRSLTQTAVVAIHDKDGATYMEISVPPADSRSVSFAEPCDFVNGLTIDDMASGGEDVFCTVVRSREL